MVARLTRSEQVERNRERVLAAARRVFMTRGYAGASLDAIAEEAGFSKGVVYSQFDSKADLFLTLLDRRIDERARRNEAVVSQAAGSRGLLELLEASMQALAREPQWTLLVLEFRTHAALDPELSRRYAVAHARTVESIATLLRRLFSRAGLAPGASLDTLAELVLALDAGIALERAARPEALPTDRVAPLLLRALGFDPEDARSGHAGENP